MKNLICIEEKVSDVKCGNCKEYFHLRILYDPRKNHYFEQVQCPACKVKTEPKLIRMGRQMLGK